MTPHQIARNFVADHLAALTVDTWEIRDAGWTGDPGVVARAVDDLCHHLDGILAPEPEPDTSGSGSTLPGDGTGAGEPHQHTPDRENANLSVSTGAREPVDEQTHLAAVRRLAQTPLPADLRLRCGGKVGRGLYAESAELGPGGVDVGRVDTTALAEWIVAAVNAQPEPERPGDGPDRDLGAIEARARRYADIGGPVTGAATAADVPALVARVRQLETELETALLPRPAGGEHA